MAIRIKLKGYDIVVLPEEGKVLGRLRKDGTRKEIATYKDRKGYHKLAATHYPDNLRSRTIWIAVNGPIPEGKEINHINHDPSDDRINNLELVTPQQNCAHRRPKKEARSGYKGVSQDITRLKRGGKKNWCAYIGVSGKGTNIVRIGFYYTAEEAALAYDVVAKEWYGPHAFLNFPDKEVV
jgi:hypothetical protein